jgi:hypothetical protein
MTKDPKSLAPRLLILIANSHLSDDAAELFRSEEVTFHYTIAHCEGTASREILDILGIGSTDKVLTMGIMSKAHAEDVLKKLYLELKLGTVNSGIAFTIPITAATSFLLSVLDRTSDKFQLPPERKDEHGMSEVKYSMIVTLVNQGFSDNVMDAARAVGAGGGTIIHTRQAFSEETVKRLGIEIHDEKELVIIIADNESKTKIMQAISESCGIKTEARGIVLSLPVDTVLGLRDRY